jgi:molecular chaperone DnaK
VKATNGDTHLGGDDWDQRVVNWAADEFRKEQGIDLRGDRQALQRLREAAEKAKIELSSVMETELNLPYITADASGPKHLQLKLTRSKFEQMTEDLLERCRKPFEAALRDAGFEASKLNEVVLVGGSSRMPMVQDLVRRLTNGKEPNKGVIRMKLWRLVRRSRVVCLAVKSRTFSCSTSLRSRWALKPWAVS